MKCIRCNSERVQKDGNHNGNQRYKCLECKKRFDFGKYEGTKVEYIKHFNVNVIKNDRNKLTRENYCVPTNKISDRQKKSVEYAISSMNYKIPNKYYIDTETYTDYYVKKHYEDCMFNFDLNMNHFSKLNKNEFEKEILKIVKKHKFNETLDISRLEHATGLYILVLDEYKQVYIGTTNNLKRRITDHWRNRKEFDRLIFGKKETSILSIDSFGALDTTRIFIKTIYDISQAYQEEEKIVANIKPKFRLNRIAGGINLEENVIIRNLKISGSREERYFE